MQNQVNVNSSQTAFMNIQEIKGHKLMVKTWGISWAMSRADWSSITSDLDSGFEIGTSWMTADL